MNEELAQDSHLRWSMSFLSRIVVVALPGGRELRSKPTDLSHEQIARIQIHSNNARQFIDRINKHAEDAT